MNAGYIQAIMPALWQGTLETLRIFFLTLLFSMPLGLVVAFGSMSRIKPIKWLTNVYVWVFRGTPLMLQIFFFYYVVPVMTPLKMDRLPAAIFTFTLNYAAYFGEIYRSGIQSVGRGQREAAKSLGFSAGKTMRLIILPQAIRNILPPVSNEIITLVKDTALVYVIGVPELMKAARDATSRDVNPMVYVIVAVIYLLLTFILTMVFKILEKRFSRYQRKDMV